MAGETGWRHGWTKSPNRLHLCQEPLGKLQLLRGSDGSQRVEDGFSLHSRLDFIHVLLPKPSASVWKSLCLLFSPRTHSFTSQDSFRCLPCPFSAFTTKDPDLAQHHVCRLCFLSAHCGPEAWPCVPIPKCTREKTVQEETKASKGTPQEPAHCYKAAVPPSPQN